MALTSSAISIRFSLNRVAAPEKVNATIKPNSAKTAPSTVPRLPGSPFRLFRPAPDTEATAGFEQDQHAEEEQQGIKQRGNRRFHDSYSFYDSLSLNFSEPRPTREMRYPGIPAGILHKQIHLECYCPFSDWARLSKFCGRTRITPPRGLSMSDMRKNEVDRASGKTRNRMISLRCAP